MEKPKGLLQKHELLPELGIAGGLVAVVGGGLKYAL